MSLPVFKTFEIGAGDVEHAKINVKRWLKESTFVSFTVDLGDAPVTLSDQIYADGVVQFELAVDADAAAGVYLCPVVAVGSSPERRTNQAFRIKIRGE